MSDCKVSTLEDPFGMLLVQCMRLWYLLMHYWFVTHMDASCLGTVSTSKSAISTVAPFVRLQGCQTSMYSMAIPAPKICWS